MRIERITDQFVPGSEGMAGRLGHGRILLSIDDHISSRGDVWTDGSNTSCSFFHSSQYRGRSWSRADGQLHSAFADCSRIFERVGNSSALIGESWYHHERHNAASRGAMRKSRKDDPGFDPIASEEGRQVKQLSIRHSPFAIRALAERAA